MAERVRLEPAESVAVDWPLDGLMRAADSATAEAPPAWELVGAPDWERVESLRLIVGAAGDTALAMAVVRPAGASDHGGDEVAVALVGPEGATGADEALLSTEYDPEGRVRRLGVELWLEDGAGKRIAADRAGDPASGSDAGLARETTPLTVRFDGERGGGLHELLRPAPRPPEAP